MKKEKTFWRKKYDVYAGEIKAVRRHLKELSYFLGDTVTWRRLQEGEPTLREAVDCLDFLGSLLGQWVILEEEEDRLSQKAIDAMLQWEQASIGLEGGAPLEEILPENEWGAEDCNGTATEVPF